MVFSTYQRNTLELTLGWLIKMHVIRIIAFFILINIVLHDIKMKLKLMWHNKTENSPTFFIKRFRLVRAEFNQRCQVFIRSTQISCVSGTISSFCFRFKLSSVIRTFIHRIHIKSVGICLKLNDILTLSSSKWEQMKINILSFNSYINENIAAKCTPCYPWQHNDR